MTMNTEWYWETSPLNKGRIAIGPRGNAPTPREVELEAWAIADIIEDANADVVGLTEIENQNVANLIAAQLGSEWTVAFSQGRDTITGQDVVLLTRHTIDAGSITTYPNIRGNAPGAANVRPSKVLGVKVEIDGDDYLFVVAHLISKRASNDARRLAQADAIRIAILGQFLSMDHIVIMGDLNDTPGSPPLNRIRGLADSQPDFIQTGRVGGSNPSFS